jgi:hypothetical protein
MAKQRKGAAPKMDIQIMYFRPKRSPKGPPIKVPAATEAKQKQMKLGPEWKVQICIK